MERHESKGDIDLSSLPLSILHNSVFDSNLLFHFRYGLRGRELVNNVGKVMIQGGGTFGTFMAIGTGLRC